MEFEPISSAIPVQHSIYYVVINASIFVSSTAVHRYDFHIFTVIYCKNTFLTCIDIVGAKEYHNNQVEDLL